MISFPVRTDIFVGREAELAFLQNRLDDLAHGRGSCVLVRGEDGSGKTRLIDELRAQNPAQAFEIVGCHASTGAGQIRDAATRAAARGPSTVIVEDADRAGAAVLDAVATYRESPALWIVSFSATAVSTEFEEAASHLRVLGAYEITLDSLSRDAMRTLVRRFRIHAQRLPRAEATRVVQLAQGNPGLANELAREFARRPSDTEGTPVPPGVRARARSMLNAIDGPASRVLIVASLIGAEFDAEFLGSVLDLPQVEVLDALQHAALHGLAREVSPGRFAFAHPLLGEAVRGEATPTWASTFHERIADALEQDGSPEGLEASAQHSIRCNNLERAERTSTRAGHLYVERGAYAEAARNFRRAAKLAATDADRGEALANLASALRAGGFDEDALSVYEAIVADRRLTLDPTARARMLMRIMQLSWGRGDMARVDALGGEILAMPVARESNIHQETVARLAGFAAGAGRYRDVLPLLERLETYAPLEPEMVAHVAQQRAFALLGIDSYDAAEPHFLTGVAIMERIGDVRKKSQFLLNFGTIASSYGKADALATLERAFELSLVSGSESLANLAGGAFSATLIRRGRLEDARAVLDRIDVRGGDLSGLDGYYLAVPMLEVGSLLADAELIERALELSLVDGALKSGEAQRIASVVTSHAMHQWCHGEEAAAQALLAAAMERVNNVRWNHEFCLAVAKCARDADIPAARAMLVRDLGSDSRIADPYTALFDAFVARRRGRSAIAVRHGNRAALGFARLNWPWYEAQALEVAGRQSEALRLYEAIGDVRDATNLRRAMRPLGRGRGQAVTLTKREHAITVLAVRGLKNKEIAQRLGIGVRTVEAHLQAVYGKFGVTSRWQIPLDFASSP